MTVATGSGRRRAVRGLTSFAAVIAAMLVLSLTSLSAGVRAASVPARSASRVTADTRHRLESAAPGKAVIVVGPVGGASATYRSKGEAIAKAAESHGMDVVRLFTPHATWADVKADANGANLFVYLGHGNGYPSPGRDFHEDSMDGLGLNEPGNQSDYVVHYYGSDLVKASIEFAPHAVVILNKLCYSAGNGEEGMPIPTLDVAKQRVDNFSQGFLASGASVVFALGWQPGENVVDGLFSSQPKSMDDIFMSRFGSNSDGSWKVYYGWVGWKPNMYYDSVRTADARMHLDPDPKEGYLRAVTGDLAMTTDDWLGASDPGGGDTDPPVVSDLSGDQSSDTFPAGDNAAPVFTPNGDGLSDTLKVHLTVSEDSSLAITVKDQDGNAVSKFASDARAGSDSFTWDGTTDAGRIARDGKYDIVVTPKDRAGNVGDPASTSTKVLTAMRSPRASADLFYSADDDALAQVSTLSVTLIRPASLTWRVTDADGNVVRRGLVDEPFPRGKASWDWDGLDDDDNPVADGTYTAVITATTDDGVYSHVLTVGVMPFSLTGDVGAATGTTQTLAIVAAEPMSGTLDIQVKQPGVKAYTVVPKRYSPHEFGVRWTVRRGPAGPVRITISGVDTDGGDQSQVYTTRIQ